MKKLLDCKKLSLFLSTTVFTLMLSFCISNNALLSNASPNSNMLNNEESNIQAIYIKPSEETFHINYDISLKQAKAYSENSYLSKDAIYQILISDEGNFSKECAQDAVDNLNVDWKENAFKRALWYKELIDVSLEDLYDILTCSYGENFTEEEAQYAIDKLK